MGKVSYFTKSTGVVKRVPSVFMVGDVSYLLGYYGVRSALIGSKINLAEFGLNSITFYFSVLRLFFWFVFFLFKVFN